MDQFKDIRPYLDDEIRPVLDRLITDPGCLSSIARFYFPRLTKLLPGMMVQAAEKRLRKQLTECQARDYIIEFDLEEVETSD